MMRIGAVSDTHGDVSAAVAAVRQMGDVAMVLHAGDHYRDGRELARRVSVPVRMVVGNCDLQVPGPAELVIEAEGARILLTHGHNYRVKHRLDTLAYRARELGVSAVVFGHTHTAEDFSEEGILFVNPGCLSFTRSRDGRRTFAVIEIAGGKCRAAISELA
ncbi:MAG: YfcE family phosphodiesterase [Chloroflexota bacterium]